MPEKATDCVKKFALQTSETRLPYHQKAKYLNIINAITL